jgi:hypothetical protein
MVTTIVCIAAPSEYWTRQRTWCGSPSSFPSQASRRGSHAARDVMTAGQPAAGGGGVCPNTIASRCVKVTPPVTPRLTAGSGGRTPCASASSPAPLPAVDPITT